MKIYTQEELKEILKSHHEWLTTPGGICANLRRANLSGTNLSDADLSGTNLSYANLSGTNLSYANLSGTNLSDADLSGTNLSYADLSCANLRRANLSGTNLSDANLSCADLRRANLSYANLSDADLSDANLSDANLSGAKGLLDPIKYIDENFEKTEDGIIVYKSFGEHYASNSNWKIEQGAIIEEIVNPLPTVTCGCGVNVGTQKWVKENCTQPVWECLIKWEWLPGVVVPYQTTGKIRASKVQLIKQLVRR
jgi:hypothetical protein